MKLKYFKEGESITEAAKKLNIGISTIIKSLNGTVKNSRKFKFEYI